MLPRLMFSILNFAASKGFAEDSADSAKQLARKAGVRGETYAYWYLRREGYIVIARNFTMPGIKGELDLVAYDGTVLAFVEVKTRAKAEPGQPTPEDAINLEKRRTKTNGPAPQISLQRTQIMTGSRGNYSWRDTFLVL